MENNYHIKTHQIDRIYSHPHFFIQNKGLHSGRALKSPIANCFVVTAQTQEQLESLYYLCQSLQVGKYFTYYIKGSVVPFIDIGDTRRVLSKAIQNYEKDQWQLKVEKLKKITAYEENLKQQITTIGQLKLALLRA